MIKREEIERWWGWRVLGREIGRDVIGIKMLMVSNNVFCLFNSFLNEFFLFELFFI